MVVGMVMSGSRGQRGDCRLKEWVWVGEEGSSGGEGGDEGMSKVHVGGVRKRAAWFFAFHFLLL